MTILKLIGPAAVSYTHLYLLSPLDSIPDLTPFIGFTDDLGIISFGLVSIACYIDKDVREKAKTKLLSLIKEVDEKEILAVDAKL